MKYPDLQALIVCRSLLQDPVVAAAGELLQLEGAPPQVVRSLQSKLAGLLLEQAETLGLAGNLWQQYLLFLLGEGDNVAARTAAAGGKTAGSLVKALAQDLRLLRPYLEMPASALVPLAFLDAYQPAVPGRNQYLTRLEQAVGEGRTPTAAAKALLAYYGRYGSGSLNRYLAFKLDSAGKLFGIKEFPQVDFKDIIGYAPQKEKLRLNTDKFVRGRQGNNVLLTGTRGTGKSMSVKAIVNLYGAAGLRLVQVDKNQVADLAGIMSMLGAIKTHKFIIFFDDLSFKEEEAGYKYLKSVIDGGLTQQPDNVLIYATSNRRHLLKETWKERSDDLAEVYRNDNFNETISLSDRFGLILHYGDLSQDEYLQIIEHKLREKGFVLSGEALRLEGVRWEMEHSGRNGRIAEQFVRWYAGTHDR